MTNALVLPWFQVEEVRQFGEVRLLPYARESRPFGRGSELQRVADAVCSLFRRRRVEWEPVDSATLLQFGEAGPFRHLHDKERDKVLRFSELLATAGLAGRRAFELDTYCNREGLLVHIVQGNPEAGIWSEMSRRIDGRTTNIVPRSTIDKPSHVVGPVHARTVDWALLESLTNLLKTSREQELKREVLAAVHHFNSANTDSNIVSPVQELVAAFAGLQVLLRAGWKKEDLVEAVASRMPRLPMPAIPEELRKRATSKEWQRNESWVDLWVYDLTEARNAFAHGSVTADGCFWGVRDHLLLLSSLFPLMLKVRLSEAGFYKLCPDDRAELEAFQPRLAIRPLQPPKEPIEDDDADPRFKAWWMAGFASPSNAARFYGNA